ncbi:hypothetical protein ACQPU1_17750 [Clostridium paraputrificum]|uniref:hypothetical protein n=1 Tax=Clostridium paraputrificum TaxID=29363 RepID=UPI003D345FAB
MAYKMDDQVNEAVTHLINALNKINSSKEKIDSVIKKVDNSSWSGESKKSFQNLIMLCEKLHQKIQESSKENRDKIVELDEKAEFFMKTNSIIKGLEE